MSEVTNQDPLLRTEPKPQLPFPQKVTLIYRNIALFSFNTLLALICLAAIAFLVSHLWRRPKSANPLDKYGRAKVLAAYPDRSPDEIARLLDETWGRPLMYEPYTQF